MSQTASEPFVRHGFEWEEYTQPEPPGARFHWVMKKDEVPGLAVGQVELTGPIHKTPAAHTEWEQVYVLVEGSGLMHLAGKTIQVQAPCTVNIPKYTQHSVEVPAGQRLRYFFINQYR